MRSLIVFLLLIVSALPAAGADVQQQCSRVDGKYSCYPVTPRSTAITRVNPDGTVTTYVPSAPSAPPLQIPPPLILTSEQSRILTSELQAAMQGYAHSLTLWRGGKGGPEDLVASFMDFVEVAQIVRQYQLNTQLSKRLAVSAISRVADAHLQRAMALAK